MTNIILPVNFSKEVRKVLVKFIHQMYTKTEDLHFILLHAYDTPKYGFAMGHDISEILKKNAISDLHAEQKSLLEHFPNSRITIHTAQGSLAKVINDYEAKYPIDFVAVALKGSNMIQDILASSRPSELASISNVPVLFLPNTDDFQLPTNIVFGTDVKPFENDEDFEGLLKISKLLKAKLHFLYVKENNTSQQEAFDKHYAKYLQNTEYSYTELEHNDAAKGILEFIQTEKANGIALIERKGNFLKRLFNISVLDHMVTEAQLPTLVINELRATK